MGDGREEFWASPDDALSPEEKRRRERESTHDKRSESDESVQAPTPGREGFLRNLKKVARARLDNRSPEA